MPFEGEGQGALDREDLQGGPRYLLNHSSILQPPRLHKQMEDAREHL